MEFFLVRPVSIGWLDVQCKLQYIHEERQGREKDGD